MEVLGYNKYGAKKIKIGAYGIFFKFIWWNGKKALYLWPKGDTSVPLILHLEIITSLYTLYNMLVGGYVVRHDPHFYTIPPTPIYHFMVYMTALTTSRTPVYFAFTLSRLFIDTARTAIPGPSTYTLLSDTDIKQPIESK